MTHKFVTPITFTFLTFCIFILLLPVTYSQFEPSRLRIVDMNENHALVRGNLPIENGEFQFKKLYKALSDLTGIKHYRLVIFSLLNFLTGKQTKNRYIQQKFFDQNGQYHHGGHVHLYKNHDILGSYFSPNDYPSLLQSYAISLYRHTTYDKIPQLLQQIQNLMKQQQKTIIYIHCSQGVDRAGYVSAAYKMKNKGISLENVTKQNLQIMRDIRKYIHFNSYNGLQWYCLSLGRSNQECLIGVQGANYGNTTNVSVEENNSGKSEQKQDKKSEKQNKKQKKEKQQVSKENTKEKPKQKETKKAKKSEAEL